MRILFVCTGNICRSPLAAAIARQELARLGQADVEVASAGVAALEGWGATDDAVRVAEENGISLAGHHARQLTPQLAAWADLVVGMERRHVEVATRLGARAAVALCEDDVPDPYGRGVEAFRETWAALAAAIPELLRARCR